MARARPGTVVADMVDAGAYERRSWRYGVRGVPMTLINRRTRVLGQRPARDLLAAIEETLRSSREPGE
jgi:predicted DsbA family dithiol-disulfide isomerase